MFLFVYFEIIIKNFACEDSLRDIPGGHAASVLYLTHRYATIDLCYVIDLFVPDVA